MSLILPDDMRSWLDIWPAQLTARSTSAGIHTYTYREVIIEPDGGGYAVAVPGREGDDARELNNLRVSVDDDPIVWMRLRGMKGGQPTWEFSGGDITADTGSGSGSGSDDDDYCLFTGVTNVCPTYTDITVGNTTYSVVTALAVEYATVDMETCQVLAVDCVTNPTGCCEVGSGSGSGEDCVLPTTLCVEAFGGLLNCACATGTGNLVYNGTMWEGTLTLACAGEPELTVRFYYDIPSDSYWMEVDGCGFAPGTLSGQWTTDGFLCDLSQVVIAVPPPNDCCGVDPEDGFFLRITPAACGEDDEEGSSSCTCPLDYPETIYATIAASGECDCLAGTYPLTYADGAWTYSDTPPVGCPGSYDALVISVQCVDGSPDMLLLAISVSCFPNISNGQTLSSACALPLNLNVDIERASAGGGNNDGCCVETVTVSLLV